ncbi:MAG: zinc ABC transporter substrate-binding protein [Lachnospiraceae bacterium]|jgi:zinc transport system substrate-binding protein|nr:zinc ABC transporter substrate-binding protein [Lachnospiraceae bacterium]
MKHKYLFVVVLLLGLSLAGVGFVKSFGVGTADGMGQKGAEQLLIVTSFYPVYIACLNIAGDCPGVAVENLSEPQTGCLHDYQLTPEDMMKLSKADVFVVNGGGMEAFLTDTAKEYPDLTILNAGEAIFSEDDEANSQEHSHTHGENAHVWMSIPHYMEQVVSIGQGLAEADPAHREHYQAKTAEYLEKIEQLHQDAKNRLADAQGKKIVLFHEAFAFFAEDYGMEIAGELDLDEERQISAQETARLLEVIQEEEVGILLAESMYGKDMGDTIEKETDCKVYYLDTLVRGEEDAESWMKGMEENIRILEKAISSEEAL